MPLYRYQCLNSQGKMVDGTVEGDGPRTVLTLLQGRGLFPTLPLQELRGEAERPVAGLRLRRRITKGDLALLTDQLRLLLASGLPLAEALDALATSTGHPELKLAIMSAKQAVVEGESLSAALARQPRCFSHDFVQMIAAGESSGRLETALQELSSVLGQQAQTMSRIAAAMAYPVLMACVGGLILLFLITAVVPKVAGVFTEAHHILPWPTRALLAASSLLSGYGLMLLVGLIVAGIIVSRWSLTTAGRLWLEHRLLKAPYFGRVAREMMAVRLARTLASLLTGGVPLARALPLAAQTLNLRVFQRAIHDAAKAVIEGRNISSALADTDLLPTVFLRMTEVGERTGNLPEVFTRVAELYENRLTLTLTRWGALAEPVMILVMGAAVGFITLAILLPIFDMSTLMR